MTSPAPLPQAVTASAPVTKTHRVESLLSALLILASELGPLFIHSAHGQAVLQGTASSVAAILAADQQTQ